MKKMMRISLLISFIVIAGGLPLIAAQESYQDNNPMRNEIIDISSMPEQHGSFFKPHSHCINHMDDAQAHPMFNQSFNRDRQQHQLKYNGIWHR